jgi:hypothetical protein
VPLPRPCWTLGAGVGPAGPGRRMLDGVDPVTLTRCTEALVEALEARRSDAGIRLGSAAWLVVARRREGRS